MTDNELELKYEENYQNFITGLEKHIKNCIEALTKDLKDHETIEVPMEFQAKNLMYL